MQVQASWHPIQVCSLTDVGLGIREGTGRDTSVLASCTGVQPYSDKTVEIVELVVPESPKVGDDVTLTCHFKLVGNNHRLYTVNWWRGKDQFYTYKGAAHNNPKHAYTFRGINVKVCVCLSLSSV